MSDGEKQFITGIDGYLRSVEAEAELNGMFTAVFRSAGGQKVIEYLRGISMHAVVPASESSERLRHQEGMRDLFRIIQERINKGKEEPNVHKNVAATDVAAGGRGRIRGSRIRNRRRQGPDYDPINGG